MALQIVWLGKVTAVGFGCRLCHLAGQCFTPGLTGNQPLGSNTVFVPSPFYGLSPWPHRWFPSQLPLVGLSGENVGDKPHQCGRQKTLLWGGTKEKSDGQSSHWVGKTWQMCRCSHHCCSWDKTNGGADDLRMLPACQCFAAHQKWQWQHTALFSPSPAGSGQPGSFLHNSFLFEPDSNYGFSKELKSKIWPPLQIL